MNQKGIASVAIAIILALFIGGGVFYAVQQEKVEKQNNDKAVTDLLEQAKNSPKLEEKDKTDETVGWKTYTNTQYGFEMQYPPHFTLKDESNGVSFVKYPSPPAEMREKSFSITVKSMPNFDFYKDVEKYIADAGEKGNFLPFEIENIVVNGIIGRQFYIVADGAWRQIMIPKESQVFTP